jgi:acyl-CoA synthetase (AMP-forming)/AMP-acid ligase II
VRGGYNVYPMEVEGVLAEHPDVGEVAVVPRPDPVMGEIGVAVVVPHQPGRGPVLEELRAFAAPHLAAYKLPEAVDVVEALPRTPMEKVDRRALQQTLAAEDSRTGLS